MESPAKSTGTKHNVDIGIRQQLYAMHGAKRTVTVLLSVLRVLPWKNKAKGEVEQFVSKLKDDF